MCNHAFDIIRTNTDLTCQQPILVQKCKSIDWHAVNFLCTTVLAYKICMDEDKGFVLLGRISTLAV